MRLLFTAGDVGGARALLPVAHLAASQGHEVTALAHGVFHVEGASEWIWLDKNDAAAEAQAADVVLYATSVSDRTSVEIAGRARAAGRPVLHLLDNWSTYAGRIAELVPDVYAVMDALALEEAIAEGVPRDILVVTGHPDLAGLAREAEVLGAVAPAAGSHSLFFVSEPAAADGGKAGRGYTETEVARALVEGVTAAEGGAAALTLKVAPHPREDRDAVRTSFEALAAEIPGAPQIAIVAPDDVRRTLQTSTHVAGMSSILLYQAWLLGRATLSLQPGLTGTALRSLSRREGVVYHTSRQGTAEAVAAWLRRRPGNPAPDLDQHAHAAKHVLDLARDLAARVS